MPIPDPLLQSKLFIPPPRPNLVPRPNLIDRLNSGMRGKLLLVSAPAGYGQTTLVSAWAQQTDQQIAWLSLDENDNELGHFLTYLIAAVQQVNSEIGADVLTVLESTQSPHANILITMLVNEVVSIQEKFVLVLDDCHLISDQSIFDAIEFLTHNLPPAIHLVLVSRVDPPIPLGRLRVMGELTEIRPDDLRFSTAETAALLNDLMKLDLPPEDISVLETRTEGWVAGLQLAAISLQGRKDKHEFITEFSGSHHYVIDYLVEEVLARQPADIRTFLCQTSILERLSAPLCDATLKITNSQQILQKLDSANLFLIPQDRERRWYRYHHLFADFLELCLEVDQSELIPLLHTRAARWFEQNGFTSEALNHYLAAKDYGEAARLVEHNARRMLERSELATLMKWVDALPEDYACSSPWLCVYHAWALRLSGSSFDSVEERIHDVEHILQNDGWFLLQDKPAKGESIPEDEARSLIGHLLGLRAFQALYTERIPQVIKLAKQAETYHPAEDFLRSSLGFALGWAYRFSGDLEAASQAFGETTEISLASGNTYMAVAALCRASYGQVMAGNLHQAMDNLRTGVQIATRENGRQLPVAGYAYVYMGGIHLEWNDLEAALICSIKGTDLCERVGYIMDQAVGNVYTARVRLAEGNLESAMDACQNAFELGQRMKGYVYVQRWVEDCQLRLWVAQENLDAVARWVSETELGVNDELSFMRDIDHIILARALLALARGQANQSYLEDALALLARLRELAEQVGWNGKLVEILALHALAFQLNEDDESALNSLAMALVLAKPEGYVRTFIDEGQPMAELLQLADSRSLGSGYARKLLDVFDRDGKREKLLPASTLVEPLSERELEVLRLMATDLSGPEIARELCVALSTVRYHSNNIYGKLSVHNRRAAVLKANKLNLI